MGSKLIIKQETGEVNSLAALEEGRRRNLIFCQKMHFPSCKFCRIGVYLSIFSASEE
jgi:hypothetical protein